MGLITLKSRAEFLRLRGGSRWVTPAFILETRPQFQPELDEDAGRDEKVGPRAPRFGFTVTKRIGNAVTRNLIRRRLKEAVRATAADHTKPGYDYVLIARQGAGERSFAALLQDLKAAFGRVHTPRRRRKS